MNAARSPHGGSPTARTAEEWVAGLAEGWRAPSGPREFAEHFRPLLAPEIRLVGPQMPTLVGFEQFRDRFVAWTFAMMPDLRGEVERWVANEDTAYVGLTMRATIGRRPVRLRACDRISLRDGVAVERETYFDPTPILWALARSPRAWPRFARVQLMRLLRRG
jgi:hypothetical protein